MIIGFSLFGLSIYIIGTFNIPIHWLVFTVLSCIIPMFWFIYNRVYLIKLEKMPINIDKYQIMAIIIFIAFFSLMLFGTFRYTWLEDDDPWAYAAGANYVKTMATYKSPQESYQYNCFLFPHSHSMLTSMLGIMNKITPDLYTLMKIFICIILLFGIIAFYLFAYHFSGKNKSFALISTFVLTITPCYVGHFIFNYTLSITMLLIFLLTLSFVLKDDNIVLIGLSGIILATVIIVHPLTAIQTAVIMFIMVIIYFFNRKNESTTIKNWLIIILIGIIGMTIASVYYIDLLNNNGLNLQLERTGGSTGIFSLHADKKYYDIKDITFTDILMAPLVTNIDQETGVGLILLPICLIGLLGIFMIKNYFRKPIAIYSAIFLFYFLFLWIFTGGIFTFSVQNIRWWSGFAIFTALLAGYTIYFYMKNFSKYKWTLLIFIILLLTLTSGIPRYTVQTSVWGAGAQWTSMEEINGFLGLKSLGYDKRIFSICGNGDKAYAMNQNSFIWNETMQNYDLWINNQSINKTVDEVINKSDYIIKYYNIQYFFISTDCVKNIGLDESNALFQNYSNNTIKYRVIQEKTNNGFVLFGVK